MTRPWVAIEAAIRVNHKLVALPSDSARWGWVCLLGEAKQQRPAGTFRSLAHLREAAGRFARFIPKYQEQHLLETAGALCGRCEKRWPAIPDGVVVVHDWALHQRDPGSAERSADWREAQKQGTDERTPNEKRTLGDTDHSRALSLSMSTSESETKPRDGYQAARPSDDVWRISQVVEELVGSFPYSRGSRVFDLMAEDVAVLTAPKVEAAYRAIRAEYAGEPMDAAGIVFGAHKRLFPIPDAPRTGKAAAKGAVSDEEANRAFGRA
jgi:hypothetical protein